MEKIMEPFGNRLKALRKAKGLKQTDMALLLECTDRHYQRMEYGLVNVPSLTLLKLADYFEVSTDFLLGRDIPSRTAQR
ncbi:MAG TPA: helix-turn-helix domain-containing protein [Candidatus Flavonifractor merdigallinarum]|uniref:Helix-turn-helix domain-containing protein n=1 Tax=Candidatus Flavonifractor merdigallinarum TaxID=2838589 RepID=A0A9D2BYQ2_9FIRM|nr:helix-turn-helix domain-containing protein [Candidatus Flavonifractor merdigallinarum]